MKLGFIGLGLMGFRMANNLIEKGNEVVVYNRTVEKANKLVEKGAILTMSPAEVGSNVKILFTMLSEPQVVEETAFSNNGFINHLKPGSIWIDCSTVNPSYTKKAALRAKQKGIRFIDAPVAGSVIQAEKGELRFFIGGDQNDVEECRDLFESMGNKLNYLGENGKGTSMKIVNNLLLAQAMVAFSEGLALGESLGFTKKQLFDILPGGPVVAPFLSAKLNNIECGTFETEFPLKWMLKDCYLATITGNENDIQLKLTNTVHDIYQQAVNSGYGEQDFSSIYKFLKNNAK